MKERLDVLLVEQGLAPSREKAKAIIMGCMLAFVGGAIAFVALIPAVGSTGVTIISIGSFVVKALGTAPAMYISLALLANILDHQEVKYGVRTDGFTMAVYGSIMVAMSGVCNGVIVGINNVVPVESLKFVHTFLGFGVEAICYLAMGIMFFFMNVENYTKEDEAFLKRKNADQADKEPENAEEVRA